jgi:hypothetical protein
MLPCPLIFTFLERFRGGGSDLDTSGINYLDRSSKINRELTYMNKLMPLTLEINHKPNNKNTQINNPS